MKKLLPFLFAFALLKAGAATVVGDMTVQGLTNNVFTAYGLDLPMHYNGKQYPNLPIQGQLTNGQLNVTLDTPGRWNISFYGADTTLRVNAPANTNTYDISQMITNVLVWVNQGISRYVQPGSGLVITTNNAGLTTESLTLSANGGLAGNVYQSQISGAGLVFSTNALQFIYTLALSANLQGWSSLATSAKQDASANLTSWSGLATSSKQDHSANLDHWSTTDTNLATVSVPGLFIPDNSTITINGQGKAVAQTGGTGNVTGDTSSTDSEISLFNGTTGKVVKRSGHFLGDYQLALGFAPTSFLNVTDVVNGITLAIDPMAQPGIVTGFGVDQNTNPVPLHFRNNLTMTADGLSDGGYYVDATGGGSATPITFTNLYGRDTNALIIDPVKAQTFSLGMLTNNILVISNTVKMTNLFTHDIEINLHQWTNGGAKLLVLKNLTGNLTTNGTWTQTTNGNVTDKLILRFADGTYTNLVISAITNCSTYTDTNSLLTGGGGGGGGGGTGLFPSDSVVGNWLYNGNLNDSSGNGNTITYHGSGVTYTTDDSGNATHAVTFNGTTEFLDVASSSVFNPSSGNFSIVMYMTNTISDFSSSPVIIGNSTFGGNGFYVQEHVAFGGDTLAAELIFQFHDGGGDKSIAANDRCIVPNVNYCIVFVRSGTSGKWYVNGTDVTQAGQPTIGTISSSSNKLTIGEYLAGSNFFKGTVQQVILYSRDLTPTEVATGSGGASQ